MCGMMYNSFGKHQTAIEYYTRAVDVLDWGQLTWRNVPTIDRGVVFEKTFIRGAKRMQLSAMHNVSFVLFVLLFLFVISKKLHVVFG